MAAADLVAITREKYDDTHFRIMTYYDTDPEPTQTKCAKALGICRSTVKRHLEAESRNVK